MLIPKWRPIVILDGTTLYYKDPEFCHQYVYSIRGVCLYSKDRRRSGGFEVRMDYKRKHRILKFMRKCPLTDNDITELADQAYDAMQDWVKRRVINLI